MKRYYTGASPRGKFPLVIVLFVCVLKRRQQQRKQQQKKRQRSGKEILLDSVDVDVVDATALEDNNNDDCYILLLQVSGFPLKKH